MELTDEGTKTMIISKLCTLVKVKKSKNMRKEMEEIKLPEMKNNYQK